MLLHTKNTLLNASIVLVTLATAVQAQEQEQHPEEVVMSLPAADAVEEEYVTFQDKCNVFNAVKGTLDPWAAASYSAGMSAMPATLPKNVFLNTWNASSDVDNGPSVYYVGNVHSSLSDCQKPVESKANLTTVQTARAWKMLYFDGSNDKRQSPVSGNLAVYLYGTLGATNLTMNEGLCQWIDGKYDGFITMEDTLKLVKCQANDDGSKVFSTVEVSEEDRQSDCQAVMSGATFDFTPKSRADYLALTGLKIHWDYAITAYGKTLNGVADVAQPIINSSLWEARDKYWFDDELTMIAEVMILSDLKPSKINWQALVDGIASMYASPLLALASAPYERFVTIVHWLASPYANAENESSSALDLCTDRHLTKEFIHGKGTPTEVMLYEVLQGISGRICSVILDLHANMTAQPFIVSQETVTSLVRSLAWSEFEACRPACSEESKCLFRATHAPVCIPLEQVANVQPSTPPESATPVSDEMPAPTPTSNHKPIESASLKDKDARADQPADPITSASPDTVKKMSEEPVSKPTETAAPGSTNRKDEL